MAIVSFDVMFKRALDNLEALYHTKLCYLITLMKMNAKVTVLAQHLGEFFDLFKRNMEYVLKIHNAAGFKNKHEIWVKLSELEAQTKLASRTMLALLEQDKPLKECETIIINLTKQCEDLCDECTHLVNSK